MLLLNETWRNDRKASPCLKLRLPPNNAYSKAGFFYETSLVLQRSAHLLLFFLNALFSCMLCQPSLGKEALIERQVTLTEDAVDSSADNVACYKIENANRDLLLRKKGAWPPRACLMSRASTGSVSIPKEKQDPAASTRLSERSPPRRWQLLPPGERLDQSFVQSRRSSRA